MNTKDVMVRFVTKLHESIFTTSRGRLLGTMRGMPVIALRTVGRKTGKPRTTMLTAPIATDDRLVVVASYGGDDRTPKWVLNLREHPDAHVTRDGTTRATRGRIASDDERKELCPEVVKANPGYGQYQLRTEREIPLVILEA